MSDTDPYNILGVNRSDSISVIKKKYHKLLLRYHPDKSIINGLDPKLANDEFRRIQDAWTKISTDLTPTPNISPVWFTFFGDVSGIFHDLKKTAGFTSSDFNNLDDFMEFMEEEATPQEQKETNEINQGIDDLFENICKVQVRETKTIDTKNILQNMYSPSIEIIMYVPWEDIEKKKKKTVGFSRSRRCNMCSKNICKACDGNNIMNCKKCLQHGFFIKKNCEICKGTGYLKEKHKIRVILEHQQDVSFYIYPEESDEKKGYDLPGDIYVKVVAD
jgi:molecular chaperone DnaJ